MGPFRLALCTALAIAAFAQEPAADPGDAKDQLKELAKGSSTVIPQIEPYLKHADREVRLEAVRALTAIGTQHSLDPLVAATRDNDPEIQLRAINGLVNFYLPGYVQSRLERMGTSLKSRFTDTNTDVVPAYITVREDVVAAAGRLARGGSSMDTRAAAARAVGVLRGRAALPDLFEALKSKNDAVLYETLVAFQKIRDVAAAPRALVYIRDLNEDVQVAALEAVGLLRYREGLADVLRAYRMAKKSRIRGVALSTAAMIADESARPVFVQALDDKSDEVRAAGAEGLARLGQADAADLLRRFEDEGKMKARLGLAFAVVAHGKTELTEFSPLQYLINTLNSKGYRGVAEAYLIELARQPMVREQMYARLAGGTRDEKIGIARVLSVSGDEQSAKRLEALSKDPDSEVATEGIRALRALRARL